VAPEREVASLAEELELVPPPAWPELVRELAASAKLDHPDGSREQRLRFLMGLAMGRLRGRVAGREVRAEIERALVPCAEVTA